MKSDCSQKIERRLARPWRIGSPGPGAIMRRSKVAFIAASLLGAGLAGCYDTQELPLAPNMVRLDVSPPVEPFIREATLRRAAELTLVNGYSAFRLVPIYTQAFDDFGVTVVMFHPGDPGAWDAFDAADVLRKLAR